jgi:hypothetical protein
MMRHEISDSPSFSHALRRSILAWYVALQFFILPSYVAVDPEASELLFRYLPSRFFQYSEVSDDA